MHSGGFVISLIDNSGQTSSHRIISTVNAYDISVTAKDFAQQVEKKIPRKRYIYIYIQCVLSILDIDLSHCRYLTCSSRKIVTPKNFTANKSRISK